LGKNTEKKHNLISKEETQKQQSIIGKIQKHFNWGKHININPQLEKYKNISIGDNT
jgi:hypothetical protein